MTSIYNYTDPVLYLSDYLKTELPKKNLNLKLWAKDVGFEGTAPIVDVLKGKKNLSPNLINAIINKIGLDPSEHNYFMALVVKNKASSDLENHLYDFLLHDLSPKTDSTFTSIRTTDSQIFSHWIFM